MRIVYYQLPAFAVAVPAGAIPWAPTIWVLAPKVSLTTAEMALALKKDIDPGGVVPFFNAGGLAQLFASMFPTQMVGGSNVLVASKSFAAVPGNWLGVFSQLAAAATSLAVADQFEKYPYCLSMQFCKLNTAAPGGAVAPPWPAAYLAAIPQTWRVAPTGPGLMPDYVIARQLPGGAFEFSTLESKGRTVAVDQATYPKYPAMKAQSQNAVIVAGPGAIAGGPPPPLLTRRILSLVAIRPKSAKSETRALRCRWTNHRNPDALGTVSDAEGLRFVAGSYAVMLHNMGFRRLAEAIAACIDRVKVQGSPPDNPLQWTPQTFGLARKGVNFYAAREGELMPGDGLITADAFSILSRICSALIYEDERRHRVVAYLLWRYTRSLHTMAAQNDQLFRENLPPLVRSSNGLLMVSSSANGGRFPN